MLTLIFLLAFMVCFGILLYFMKATQTAVAVQRGLERISQERRTKTVESTILKQHKFSSNPWMHNLLSRLPISERMLSLVKQAGVEWWVSSLIFNSLLLAGVGALIAWVIF